MAHQTRTDRQAKTSEGFHMQDLGPWLYVVVFLVLPWLVIAADVLLLGFNFWLFFTMLLLFGLGVVLGPAFFEGDV